MKNTVRLSVPNPCSEKWENFTPTSTGGYCGSCFKTVIDFTKMSDSEIVQFLKEKPAHTCGRFRNDQLKDYSLVPLYSIRPSRMLLRAGLVSLLLALVAKPSFAISNPEPVKKDVTNARRISTEVLHSVDQLIKGVVKDEDGNPIPGVNIVLAGTSVGMISDSDGKFEFPQRLKEGDVLMFSFIGYITQEYRVSRIVEESVFITMKLDVEVLGDLVVMGEVDVEQPYAPKSKLNSFLTVIKRWFE
jgi:hypothetical protein